MNKKINKIVNNYYDKINELKKYNKILSQYVDEVEFIEYKDEYFLELNGIPMLKEIEIINNSNDLTLNQLFKNCSMIEYYTQELNKINLIYF